MRQTLNKGEAARQCGDVNVACRITPSMFGAQDRAKVGQAYASSVARALGRSALTAFGAFLSRPSLVQPTG